METTAISSTETITKEAYSREDWKLLLDELSEAAQMELKSKGQTPRYHKIMRLFSVAFDKANLYA
jgi:hypothetical protein